MKLDGRWIKHAGFEDHQRVRITVAHRRLIITKKVTAKTIDTRKNIRIARAFLLLQCTSSA